MKKVLLALLTATCCIFAAACMTVDLNVQYPHFHEYDGAWVVTEQEHKRQCIDCNEVNEGSKSAHVWKETHECITCGYQAKHAYGDWEKVEDTQTHEKGCVCGSVITEECSGGVSSCTEKAVCTGCGEEYSEKLAHDFANGEWITTATGHEKKCADCTEVDESSVGEHTWDNTHKCTTCEYQGEHEYASEWTENEADVTHDYACACGAVQSVDCDCNAWDGVVGSLPEMVGDELVIASAQELAAFAQSVNEGNGYAGKTIKLSADINLNNLPFMPIGYTSTCSFRGSFDGQGHVIKNLKIAVTNEVATTEAGLFGWVQNASIKNITVNKINVSGEKRVGGIVGYVEVIGSVVVLENCHVMNATLVGERVGGIVGYVNPGVTIKNCSVKKATITAVKSQGKIVGYNNSAVSVGNIVEEVTLVNDLKDTFEI